MYYNINKFNVYLVQDTVEARFRKERSEVERIGERQADLLRKELQDKLGDWSREHEGRMEQLGRGVETILRVQGSHRLVLNY